MNEEAYKQLVDSIDKADLFELGRIFKSVEVSIKDIEIQISNYEFKSYIQQVMIFNQKIVEEFKTDKKKLEDLLDYIKDMKNILESE